MIARCRTRVIAAATMLAGFGIARATAEEATEFFEKRVRPVLVERCYSCHSAEARRLKAGLRLDGRAHLLAGGDTGPAIVPGDPERSRLIEAIRYENVDLQMPPQGRLSREAIEHLTAWVRAGAVWPEPSLGRQDELASPAEAFDLAKRKQSHWAWHPVAPSPLPPVKDPAWVGQPTDAFLLARLEAAGLKPARRAEPQVLLRRLAFDLLGLPPTTEEVEAFGADPSSAAWERQVARWLDSPRFGERWARHWLDLVRYAETLGHEFDYVTPNAWRYRDYVIRALNSDVPFDQFAREHIAGDLLDPPRRHPTEGFNESLIGTGFYWLGQRAHSPVDVKLHQAEVIDDQVDVLTKTFLGLTVSCARCHDHKFDAISTRDYYALSGILGSSRYAQRSVEGNRGEPEILRTLEQSRARLQNELAAREQASCSVLEPSPPTPGGTVVLADFSKHGFDGWFIEGEAFGAAPAAAGRIIVLATNLLSVLDRPSAHSADRARRLEGILSSPTFLLTNRYLHVLAAGRSARFNVRVENLTMIRDPIYGGLRRPLERDAFQWTTVDVGMWQGRDAYVEFSDIAAPDLTEAAPLGASNHDGYFALAKVVLSDEAVPPQGPDDEAWARLIELPSGSPAIAAASAFRDVERRLKSPTRVPAMMEGSGRDETVFVRGNPKRAGEVVPRRFLEATGSEPPNFAGAGSGRLALAREITDPGNPLFARVIVNRVWLHLFGRGLVASPDNFGVLGEAPSHPELLDWLAHWFRTEGAWSLKRLIRLLTTSSAYQMSSRPEDLLAEAQDPENRLWHRMPIRRLEGEAIRDAILAVSGGLDLEMYGPPVPAHLTDFMAGRGRPSSSGPLDGNGRRSIYLEVRRNFLPPMMRAFDTPVPFTTVGRRTVSNVPAQSLILLNDPFVQGEAARWARRTIETEPASDPERIAMLYHLAFGRAPTAEETRVAEAFLGAQRAGGAPDEPASTWSEADELRVWSDLCHVLLNVKEFIYVP